MIIQLPTCSYEQPKIGDKKTKIKFALFPRITDDHKLVWLEKVMIDYEYEKDVSFDEYGTCYRELWRATSTKLIKNKIIFINDTYYCPDAKNCDCGYPDISELKKDIKR